MAYSCGMAVERPFRTTPDTQVFLNTHDMYIYVDLWKAFALLNHWSMIKALVVLVELVKAGTGFVLDQRWQFGIWQDESQSHQTEG